eukprot:gnl/TRDRNA2_/TRDRNA2_175940_c4_seq3.p1 gnl/TRDRNA2_/TRDRNA2_175940_c4~~gnl/TRDRNA2_/TRDRNA2_175940_c4_seq3.p1  ORF type:complete len:212 (+),score=34.50 gnl/TRDRNA2_/TRDRNA2_175940_c4_seq3:83-718(+)
MSEPPFSMGPLAPVVLVTIGFMALNMWFTVNQVLAKINSGALEAIKSKKPFNRFNYEKYPRWEMADRSFLNLQEQAVPFLMGLWLHACFVDPALSAVLGWIWIGARFLSPVLWSLLGTGNIWINLSTQINTLVLSWLILATTYKGATGNALLSQEAPTHVLFLYMVIAWLVVQLVAFIPGLVLAKGCALGFKEPEQMENPLIEKVQSETDW